MSGRQKITAIEREAMVIAYQRGDTLAAIAARYGVSQPYVSVYCAKKVGRRAPCNKGGRKGPRRHIPMRQTGAHA